MTRLTSLLSVTWTSSGLSKISCPCAWIALLRSLLIVCLGLGAHLFFCVILMASQSPSFVPVLRRSCLFQEIVQQKELVPWLRAGRFNKFDKNPCHLKAIFITFTKCHSHSLIGCVGTSVYGLL